MGTDRSLRGGPTDSGTQSGHAGRSAVETSSRRGSRQESRPGPAAPSTEARLQPHRACGSSAAAGTTLPAPQGSPACTGAHPGIPLPPPPSSVGCKCPRPGPSRVEEGRVSASRLIRPRRPRALLSPAPRPPPRAPVTPPASPPLILMHKIRCKSAVLGPFLSPPRFWLPALAGGLAPVTLVRLSEASGESPPATATSCGN